MFESVYREWDLFCEDPEEYEKQTNAFSDPALAFLGKAWRAKVACVRSGQPRLCSDLGVHEADIIVGLVATDYTVDVNVMVGGACMHTISLVAGRAQLILGNNCIPTLTLPYQEVRLNLSKQGLVEFVYAYLPDDFRKTFIFGSWRTDQIYFSGGFAALVAKPGVRYARLVNYIPKWRRMVEKKIRQLDVYKEELMVCACHPHRMDQIGL